jgi:hypothetical protein
VAEGVVDVVEAIQIVGVGVGVGAAVRRRNRGLLPNCSQKSG